MATLLLRILVLCSWFALSGCATELVASRADGTKLPGVPVGTPKLVKITTITSYKPVKKGQFEEYCTPEVNSEIKFLPLGEVAYLNMDPAAIAKGEFTLEFSDSGNIKKVSLNSDASSGIESANTLASTLLPFIASPKTPNSAAPQAEGITGAAATNSPPPTAKALKEQHCLLAGTTVSTVESAVVNQ